MRWNFEADPVRSSHITGRLRPETGSSQPPPLELWIDGAFEANIPAGSSFRAPLPADCFDTQEHSIELRLAGQRHEQTFQSRYEGYLDPFSEDLLTGWILDESRPNVPLEVEVELDGAVIARMEANRFRPHLLAREGLDGHNGFELRVPDVKHRRDSFVLRVRLPAQGISNHSISNQSIEVQRSPVLSVSRPRLVGTVQRIEHAFQYLERCLLAQPGAKAGLLTEEERLTFAGLMLDGSNAADLLDLRQRFLLTLQPQLAREYSRRDYTIVANSYPGSVPRRASGLHQDRPIDVIVPVYAGLVETRRCLESVLRAAAGCRYQLLCILDCPENREMLGMLTEFAARNAQVSLHVNEATVGFAASVNWALRQHHDRDAVILQADCEVSGDWLARLQQAAYDGSGAGIVNPMTADADFVRYPAPALPFQQLDSLARGANAGRTVALPAAMGFCFFVRRACLDDLGLLHNDEASGGYFAEKYFSINAAARGWRTLIATNVFVKHLGGVSFAARGLAGVDAAQDSFFAWCPFYQDQLTDFLADDPLFAAKRELDVARLALSGRKRFCFISHGEGGGTERHLRDLDAGLQPERLSSLILYAAGGHRVVIAASEQEGIENLHYSLATDFDRLVCDLKRLQVLHIHIHSNVNLPAELFLLAERLNLPYDITVHDYAWFCPRVNLIDRSGQYCEEPPVDVCESCTGQDVRAMRQLSKTHLEGARRVFFPSEDARQRLLKQFALTNTAVRAHPELIPAARTLPALPPQATVRVAIIGRISVHKGLLIVQQCASHALEAALPLEFVVVGGTSDDSVLAGLSNVSVTGPYQEGEVDGVIARSGARVSLLPSIWPETYSYTLSIALRNGLTPVAFDLGAPAERIRQAGTGRLLPPGTPAAEINEALLNAGRQPQPKSQASGARYRSLLRDYYEIDHRNG